MGEQMGAWIEATSTTPVTVDHATLSVVTDGRHTVPTQVSVVADGVPARTLPLPTLHDSDTAGAVQTVDLSFDPVTAKSIRLVVERVRPKLTTPGPDQYPVELPVAIAEAGFSNVPLAAAPATVDTGCRDDLVQVNGQPFPVAIRGAEADARSGLDVVACDASLALPEGSNRLTSTEGLTTGIDIDRVVLSSDVAGTPAPITAAGAPSRESGAAVRVTSSTPDSYHLKVRTDGTPFWLVLGQSQNDGWEATVNGKSLGTSHLVNGFANGWTVRPGEAGTVDIVLRWTPQRAVWIGLAVSGLAIVACLVLVLVPGRRSRPGVVVTPSSASPVGADSLFDPPVADSPGSFAALAPSLRTTVAAAFGAGVLTALVSRWWIGLLVAAAVLVAPRLTRGRLLLAAGSPVALALGALLDIPELGWLAIGLLLADILAGALWARRRPPE